ncbi:MAG: sulfite exporter TauE/SafE family protein [Clostridiales bacterium]|nr:sulfite exporter TauE/SafE family protein [Clostridiales bacterium]
MEIVFMALCGLLAGIIGGMGMGGGTLLIPMLTVFFGVGQHAAQAVNLVSFIPMSAAALFIHMKNELIDYKKALIIIAPALASAVGGSFLAKSTRGEALGRFFGGFLIILAALQIITFIANKKKEKKGKKA